FQNFSTGLGTGILENLISFSIGDCDHQFNPVGMGLIEQQLNKLQLGASTQSVQTIKLRLLIGTLTSKVQSIVNALRSDSSGISASLNIITEGVQGVQSLKGSFSFGDVIKGVHGILNNLSASATGQQAVKNIIVAGINKTQALINAITRGENITSVQSIVNKLASDARSVQIVKNIIAESVGGIQTLMTALTLGETLKGIQATTNNLPDNISGVEQLKIQISSGVQSVQGLLGALVRGDNIKGVQAILDKLASDTRGLQSLKGILSDGIQDVQSLVNALTRGDNIKGVQAILDKLADNSGGVHLLLNLVAEGVDSFQKILITLSGEPAQGIKALLLQLHPSDLIQNMQVLINEMYEQQIQFHSTSYEIYLDGSPISKKTTSAVIDYSQSSIHNTITITSADMNLFQISDPQTLSGQSRIEVQIDGSRVIYFLLETRSGDERFFELWGRSISARDDAPYANDSDFTLSGPQLASSIAESLPVYAAVDWETTDWVVPDEFEYSGTPIDGISKLAQAIGAVVRCQDDGSLTVRNRYPVRPVNMDAATADSDYDRQDILKLNYKFNEKSGYNAVIVTGKTTDVYSPDIEVEESSPIVGDTVHVRVYWADKKPSTISPYVTDGTITDLGDFEETLTETLDFKEGIATVSKPIESVSTTTWIGDLGGSVAYVVNEKDVIIADNAFRVGTVKYTTKYQRFRLTGHSVTQLLAVLMYSDIPDVYVKVKTSAEDENLAPMISESLLSTDEAAIQRGTAELDNILYDSQEIPIRIAYNVNNVDGNLVYINDPKIDHSGNYHIDSAKIIFNKIQVINEIEAHKCLVS
ncbi:MAG: hypothetical protein U9P90_01580, partial [Patescibacteria group bacterium]|nr:hypothetical protein [Patescibacteria group bacterium]